MESGFGECFEIGFWGQLEKRVFIYPPGASGVAAAPTSGTTSDTAGPRSARGLARAPAPPRPLSQLSTRFRNFYM